MEGMSMSMGAMASGGLFEATNSAIARGYWYAIAACVALLFLIRIINSIGARWTVRTSLSRKQHPSRQQRGLFPQVWATLTAVIRELSNPQPVVFTGSFTKHLSPPPLGRCILILTYWIVILTMLWSNVILAPTSTLYGYKWEIVAFRGAWVSVMQVPALYGAACKLNVISIFTGISYERINWIHRWIALTLFLTVIVHWSFFFTEWTIADFVSMELQLMPMVKYGFGAWGLMGWMVLSSFGLFRELGYEFWVLQHLGSGAAILWLLYKHVPAYAAYNIWLAVAFIAFDQGGRFLWQVVRNMHVPAWFKRRPASSLRLGFDARVQVLPHDMVKLTIPDADFSWRVGQHVYMCIPSVGVFETHPFTIASICTPNASTNTLELYIRAKQGFSRRLLRRASKSTGGSEVKLRTLLSGPWGNPPSLSAYDTVVFIAASTGASFNMPLLQRLVADPGCVRIIHFHWIVRHAEQLSWFKQQILQVVEANRRFSVRFHIHITSETYSDLAYAELESEDEKHAAMNTTEVKDLTIAAVHSSTNSSAPSISMTGPRSSERLLDSSLRSLGSDVAVSRGQRPSMAFMIRDAVEAAEGETAVVICGGASLTAAARTYAAGLSDELAVEKGTGARGIYIFAETYGW